MRYAFLGSMVFVLFLSGFVFADELNDDEFFFEDDTGITIVAARQTSQHMTVIGRQDIEQRSAADLASLLQETIALNIARYGPYGNQTSIHLRGYSSRRVAFLIDGVPVNSSMDGRFDINQIDLNSVERIEVIYGGSDTTFNVSGAMGGVINIITVKKQNPGWRFNGSLSNTASMPGEYRDRSGERQDPHWEDLLDAQSIAVSVAYGGGTAFGNTTAGNTTAGSSSGFSFRAGAFANRAANHFLFNDFVNITRRKDNNEVWDAGANGSAVWGLGDVTRLIASANCYYGDKNIPTSGYSSIFGTQQDFVSRQTLMLEAPRAGHDDLAAEASLSWHFARMDYTSPAAVFSRHDQNSLSAISRLSWYPGERLASFGLHVLRSGLDYRYIHLDSTEIGGRSRHDGGIYLTAEFSPLGQLQVIPSVKAVYSSTGSMSATAIPKLGLLVNVTDSLVLKNNYFRSFKFPEFEELYWSGGGGSGTAVGNPDLRPEDGWGGDLGASWNLNRLLALESVFFAQFMKDSIHWAARSGGIWRPENVGEAVFFGLDNKLSINIPVSMGPIQHISLSFAYKYLRSYLLSFGYTFASDKRIPYNPEHTIGGTLDISWESGSLLISGHYESVRYNDRANLTVLEPYFLLNATVNQKISENLSAFGVVRNILNTSYESFYDYPMPGITLTMGIRLNFEANNHE